MEVFYNMSARGHRHSRRRLSDLERTHDARLQLFQANGTGLFSSRAPARAVNPTAPVSLSLDASRVPESGAEMNFVKPFRSTVSAKPGSHLLVCDLDNTLYAVKGHEDHDAVAPRPFLKNFIDYVLHPKSAWNLAIWTTAARKYAIAHLRSVGLGPSLFKDSDSDAKTPKLADGVEAFWGYEDCHFTPAQLSGQAPIGKNLQALWDDLNRSRSTGQQWSKLNSVLVDDQKSNAYLQPSNLIKAPVFTETSDRNNDFLLQLIGRLEELSTVSDVSALIESKGWQKMTVFKDPDADTYALAGRATLKRLDINIARNTDPSSIPGLSKPVSRPLVNDAYLDASVKASQPPSPFSDVHTDSDLSDNSPGDWSDSSTDGEDDPQPLDRFAHRSSLENRFILEEEELARRHGRPFRRTGSPASDLSEAVRDWEIPHFDPPLQEEIYEQEEARDYRYYRSRPVTGWR